MCCQKIFQDLLRYNIFINITCCKIRVFVFLFQGNLTFLFVLVMLIFHYCLPELIYFFIFLISLFSLCALRWCGTSSSRPLMSTNQSYFKLSNKLLCWVALLLATIHSSFVLWKRMIHFYSTEFCFDYEIHNLININSCDHLHV